MRAMPDRNRILCIRSSENKDGIKQPQPYDVFVIQLHTFALL